MQDVKLNILNVAANSGVAFGFFKDDDGINRQIYIPRRVLHAIGGVKAMQAYDAVIVPNKFSDTIPYMAVFVKPREEAAQTQISAAPTEATPPCPPAPEMAVDAAMALLASGGTWTMKSIMDRLFGRGMWSVALDVIAYSAIRSALTDRHNAGTLAQANVYQSADQTRPSKCVWAADWRELLA